MRLRAVLSVLAGCLLLGGLASWLGPREIAATIVESGWTAVLVSIYRAFPLGLDAMAWWLLFPKGWAPGIPRVFRDRWIGESVNMLLPVAQVGGDVARAHLAARALEAKAFALEQHREAQALEESEPGASAVAGATVAVDFAGGLLSQLLFTLTGALLLVTVVGGDALVPWLLVSVAALALGLLLTGLFARRDGVARAGNWLEQRIPVSDMARVAGGARSLSAGLTQTLRRGRRLALCLAIKSLAWFARAFETFLIMRAIGIPIGFADAVMIEAIGSAARSMGFAIPGAVGIQEGGYVAAAALLGHAGEAALALALVKRARELLTSLPGLGVWALAEWSSLESLFVKRRPAEPRNFQATARSNGRPPR